MQNVMNRKVYFNYFVSRHLCVLHPAVHCSLQFPNRLLHVTFRDLEKSASNWQRCQTLTSDDLNEKGVQSKDSIIPLRITVLVHSEMVKKLETPVACLGFCQAHGLSARDHSSDLYGQSIRLSKRQGGKK